MQNSGKILQRELRKLASHERALSSAWFFKTGKGEYGEGDIFLGVRVPDVRKVARRFFELSESEVLKLLKRREHEFRLAALLILVNQFQRGDERSRKHIFELYLKETRYINNWDLVDLSAPAIVGEYLRVRDRSHKKLFTLAHSSSLWERRIAIVATFAFIRQDQAETALEIAKILLQDREDLIQKATGWMLREVGKRVGSDILEGFLDQHASVMPRTMLRYALERLPLKKRAWYMKQGFRGVK